jgi:hypothetical protein
LYPCSWGFEFFLPDFQKYWNSREEYARNVTPYRILVVVQITFFRPSSRGLEFPLLHECLGALLKSQWGVLGLCVLWEAGLLASTE